MEINVQNRAKRKKNNITLSLQEKIIGRKNL